MIVQVRYPLEIINAAFGIHIVMESGAALGDLQRKSRIFADAPQDTAEAGRPHIKAAGRDRAGTGYDPGLVERLTVIVGHRLGLVVVDAQEVGRCLRSEEHTSE